MVIRSCCRDDRRRRLLAAAACLILWQGRPSAATPTFNDDIAPVLERHCVSCHRAGGVAPFPLTTYEEARRHARQIADVTRRGTMPPWKASRLDPPFVGQSRPAPGDIARIAAWVSGGAPEGTGRRPRAAIDAGSGWRLGQPDLVLTTDQGFVLPAGGSDLFRNFVLPSGLTSGRFVRGIELLPGSTAVHHVNIRVDRTHASRDRDAVDPLPGYEGLLSRSAAFPDGHFLGWTPGQTAPLLPDGLAWRLDAGADIVLQVHMQPSGRSEPIRPSLGIYFTDAPPRTHVAMIRLGRQNIAIPPDVPDYIVEDSFTLPVDVQLLAVQPHAHYRARDARGEARLPDGRTMQLLHIDDWDFRWQHLYRYVTPLDLPRGTTLSMRYRYDNSAGNPRNPVQPPAPVTWGQRSHEEMGDLWFQVAARTGSDQLTLNRAFRPKAVAEDLVGYEGLIRRSPDDVGLRDDAAVLYLELGRAADAATHWREAVRIQPAEATSRFNLASALAVSGDERGAIASLREALRLNPNYTRARVSVARLLLRAGAIDEALAQVDLALAANRDDVEAHYQRGLALRVQGDRNGAIASLRRAVQLAPRLTPARMDLAWMLATSATVTPTEATEALGHAEAAVAQSGDDAVALDVLAVTLAAAGRFDEAVATAGRAIAGARNPDTAAEIQRRQSLFRQRQRFTR